ncbi:nucleotide-diphospho-sugar transferase [Dentipellis sp. KUC8613]|nr:nucleotide-diphospho-sugar transferase [Dentipellis sp. KUC8613]
MRPHNAPYFRLTNDGWKSAPQWAIRARSHVTWLHCALSFTVLLNIILGLAWRRHHIHHNFSPLDDYQILKEDYNLITPSDPNATAIVSSLYNELYLFPVLTLGHSISQHYGNDTSPSAPSPRRLLLYIPGRISSRSLCLARAVGWTPHPVSFIPPPHNGADVFYRFVDQYTKLALWTLDQIGIERVVYLDGDTLVRQRFDELFALPFSLAAVPDAWPKGFKLDFNAGVLALQTSTKVFDNMIARMDGAQYPLRMAEQAYLNLYFGAETVKLPYVYNANLVIKLRSPRLWHFMSKAMRVVHYTMPKPFPLDPALGPTGEGSLEDARVKVREAIDDAKSIHGGLYKEEIGWWEDAWREMESDRRHDIQICERD